MRASLLVPSLLVGLLLSESALAIAPSSGGVRLYGPPAFDNGSSGASETALPRGVSGLLPERDGEPFFLEVEAGTYRGDDERSLRDALEEILPATGFRGDIDSLEIVQSTRLNTPDADEVARIREADTDELRRVLEARFRELSAVTERALELQADDNEAAMLASRTVVSLQQTVDRMPIRGLGLSIVVDEDGDLQSLAGALTNVGELSGKVRVEAEKAEALAAAPVEASAKIDEVGAAEAVLVATGRALRPAWQVQVLTTGGREYSVTVDAESGDVLGVSSLDGGFVPGQGLNFSPDPDVGTELTGFEVNAAADGVFTLTHDDVGTVETFGADGCGTDPVSVPDNNPSFANFNTAALSNTNVDFSTDAGYNCRFQEINAFGRVTTTLYWLRGMGAEDSPPLPIRVDVGNACGDGPNQACAGGGKLTFGIGGATLNGTTNAGDLLNLALDETAVAHEIGHHVYARQLKVGGGAGNGSAAEGIADYVAMALLDQPSVADYTGTFTGMYLQNGGLPRRADTADVFPDHFDLGTDVHANGQIIANALWIFRTEMGKRSAIGEGLATRMLLTALTHTGYGVTNDQGTEQEVYGAYQSLLSSSLLDAGYLPGRLDLIQAYAQAGVFTTKHEAVINISDDYLSPGDPAPTFRVWPGEDFTFSGGDASDSTGYNKHYEIELANDADFTVNVVSSGPQYGFSEWSGGNTVAAWTPNAADWATLTGGSLLYYRVRTWNDEGGNQRDSEHTMAGFMPVPTAVAVINGGGSAGCSSAGGRGAGWLGALLALGAVLRRRR